MRRSLTFFWRNNLAVAAGAALAATVLTGSLLVGDSVRGSLRALTLGRLGSIDHAVVARGWFAADLADRLAADPGFTAAYGAAEPAILTQASAVHADTRARASKVNLLGVGEGFTALYPGTPAGWSFGDGGGVFPPVVLNAALAGELGAAPGDAVLLSFTRASDVPRGMPLGRRDAGQVVQQLRLEVAAVVPDEGPGTFGLAPHQSLPRNAFLRLEDLQKALSCPGESNALLVAGRADSSAGDPSSVEPLREALRRQLELEDFGLELLAGDGHLTVESRQLLLKPETAETVREWARETETPAAGYSTYLANALRKVGERDAGTGEGEAPEVPYSTVTALKAGSPALGALTLTTGEPAPPLAEGEIHLGAWAAEDLGAAAGDEVELDYFVVGEGEQLSERSERFRVAGVVALEGPGADPSLTPEVPGISDAEDLAAWDPPFPVDLGRIRPKDELYWDEYRGTPKAFISLADGLRLWQSRYGSLTALRLAPLQGDSVETLAAKLEAELPERLALAPFGLDPLPVKARGLEGSRGASDFGGLFIAFSWFLIVAAALLVALLFRLGVEQRAREVGLFRALGFSAVEVRRRFVAEGGVLALVGTLAGLAGAVGYAALMMAGLGSWWVDAVGSKRLALHVEPVSLGVGASLALAVTLGTIWLAVRRLRRVATPALLAGTVAEPGSKRPGRLPRILAWGGAALALALLAAAGAAGSAAAAGIFFGVGAALLVSGLGAFALWCRGTAGKGLGQGPGALALLAVRSSARNAGRSILSVVLVASACFVVVSVQAFRQEVGDEVLEKSSGAGGYALVAESDVPLFEDLADPEGRFALGLPDEAGGLLDGAEIQSLRLLPGDDASCLNLFRPEKPRLLGVPPGFVERGGFTFQQAAQPAAQQVGDAVPNRWTLLEADLGRDPETGAEIVPAVGDFETATWILKLGLGDDLAMEDERGRPILLRIVGLLHGSIFQSELLISEEKMLEHFPSREGYSYFLLAAPDASPEEAAELAAELEGDLADFGFDASSTRDRLAGFLAVRNTFISTFQALGGFGLLLGTLGLAVVLLRNVVERRGELAALRAFGFRRRLLARLILLENAFLLALGLMLGGGAALVASLPYLVAGGGAVPWGSLAATLGLIFAVGLAASAVATRGALRADLLPALKGL